MPRSRAKSDERSGRLRRVREATRLRFLVRRDSSTIDAAGDPAPDRTADIAERIVDGVAWSAIDAALEKNPQLRPAGRITTPDLWDMQEAFMKEFDPDPVDALRGLDDKLYLEFDRERAEREVRLAVSLPLIGFGAFAAIAWSPWFYVVVALGAILFLKNAVAQSVERSRIMKLVEMRQLETPALRAAAAAGRDALRAQLSSSNSEPRTT